MKHSDRYTRYVEQERKALEELDRRTRALCDLINEIEPTARIAFVNGEMIIECSEENRARIVAELCK